MKIVNSEIIKNVLMELSIGTFFIIILDIKAYYTMNKLGEDIMCEKVVIIKGIL